MSTSRPSTLLLFGVVTVLTLLSVLPSTIAIPQIARTGKYLYDDSGNRFYIKVSALSWLCRLRIKRLGTGERQHCGYRGGTIGLA